MYNSVEFNIFIELCNDRSVIVNNLPLSTTFPNREAFICVLDKERMGERVLLHLKEKFFLSGASKPSVSITKPVTCTLKCQKNKPRIYVRECQKTVHNLLFPSLQGEKQMHLSDIFAPNFRRFSNTRVYDTAGLSIKTLNPRQAHER